MFCTICWHQPSSAKAFRGPMLHTKPLELGCGIVGTMAVWVLGRGVATLLEGNRE